MIVLDFIKVLFSIVPFGMYLVVSPIFGHEIQGGIPEALAYIIGVIAWAIVLLGVLL